MTPNPTLRGIPGCHEIDMREMLAQTNNLVNPNSGIANDYLNQYIEILLLVENLPSLLPEMVEELLAWKPKTYDEYFRLSPLPGSAIAIKIYHGLDKSFRKKFEARIAKINKLTNKIIKVIGKHKREHDAVVAEDIELFCRITSINLRRDLDIATNLVNNMTEHSSEPAQIMADRLMQV
ncbi:MAG: hypothetical protein ACLPWS_22045 [Rhodomicrobium sp.]